MEHRNQATPEKIEKLKEYYSKFNNASSPATVEKQTLVEDEDAEKYMEILSEYYENNKTPPIEAIVEAFRILGYTDEKVELLVSKHTRHEKLIKKFGPKIDEIFSENKKRPIRPKKVKRERQAEAEVENENEEEEDEQENVEDNEFDIEPDEEVEEPEEYVDDEADD